MPTFKRAVPAPKRTPGPVNLTVHPSTGSQTPSKMTRSRRGRNISHVPRSANSALGIEQQGSSQKTCTPPSGESRGSRPTHFLCIPLVTDKSRPLLESALRRFSQDVRREGIPQAAVRPVGSIHLTIGVMSLPTPDRMEAVTELLKNLEIGSLLTSKRIDQGMRVGRIFSASYSLTQAYLEDGGKVGILQQSASSAGGLSERPAEAVRNQDLEPIKVSLRSLYPMQQSNSTTVLYTSPHDQSELLHLLCTSLHESFTAAGFIVADRPFKMHATVLNMVYAKQRAHGGRGRRPTPINGDPLLASWKDVEWTDEFELEKIAICKMGAKKSYDASGEVIDESYEEIFSISLPTSNKQS